jgi:hypothetical protein
MKKVISVILFLIALNCNAQRGNFFMWQNTIPVTCPSIGDSYGGGIVAYILQSGDPGYVSGQCHGLIAASSDQSSGTTWDTGWRHNVSTSTDIGQGYANSLNIVSASGVDTTYAALTCRDLTIGGYTDWFLPSQYELQKIYFYKSIIGGFTVNGHYWSSYQDTYDVPNRAIFIDFTNGGSASNYKSTICRVRAIRSF